MILALAVIAIIICGFAAFGYFLILATWVLKKESDGIVDGVTQLVTTHAGITMIVTGFALVLSLGKDHISDRLKAAGFHAYLLENRPVRLLAMICPFVGMFLGLFLGFKGVM